MAATISTYNKMRSGSPTKIKRLWLWVVLILAVMLASSAVVAASAQAGSFNHYRPNLVLMKGKTELQNGRIWTSTWHYYQRGWVGAIGDGFYSFPQADLVRAGSNLHIRLNKPQRPERFRITAYKNVDKNKFPIGDGQRLDASLKRVKRDGKTVAWNAFFRLNKPERHYYLETHGVWKRVPGTHISYGDAFWNFHVKTR
jgi:hypothetical protein